MFFCSFHAGCLKSNRTSKKKRGREIHGTLFTRSTLVGVSSGGVRTLGLLFHFFQAHASGKGSDRLTSRGVAFGLVHTSHLPISSRDFRRSRSSRSLDPHKSARTSATDVGHCPCAFQRSSVRGSSQFQPRRYPPPMYRDFASI